ncbi:3-hydroxyacyl-CoA dehydrogenase NAD-binding domain-containing protein [Bradyrhizobium murdochi]|uniref:3-hydroxyacyl-CoA dehydrogenase family protein n=1 Tax=Bradyrhizobium murdochi TaxID=1038859 RepID=UPI0009FCC8AA
MLRRHCGRRHHGWWHCHELCPCRHSRCARRNHHEALKRGLLLVRKNYEASAANGKLSSKQVEKRMGLLSGSLDYAVLASCDLIIEAVFKNLQIKKDVCARLGQVCKTGAIIATNTSTLEIDVLAEAAGRPADIVGMHFFSPANVMRLFEVVRGAKTAPDILATAMRVSRAESERSRWSPVSATAPSEIACSSNTCARWSSFVARGGAAHRGASAAVRSMSW